ncbi:MAG: pyridoxal phosphate-dependent aminotransferase [Oscillospiraceae bacterium]|nr:pyridoxal phosphate-dependent aminotransferase [Oscillospiraceae bacterium]
MYNKTAYEMGTNGCTIRELAAYGAARAQIVGEENVFNFTIGNPSLPAPREVTDTVRDILDNMDNLAIHSYTSATGDLRARGAIAKDLNNRFGTDITADELFLGCGASPELCAVFGALSMPGGEIIAIAPYFSEYEPFAQSAGCSLKVVAADVPNFQIRLDAVEAAITANTVAIIINSPNNPSGVVYTRNTLEQLAQLLERKAAEFGHAIYIVADEPYRELAYDGVEVPFIPTIYRDTIVCYSYSKSLSLPGERIGYIYVPRQATDGVELYTAVAGAARGIGHICAPSLWQHVIARCAHLQPDLSEYNRNRKALYEGLRQAGYEVAKPDGAFYMFVKAPGGDSEAFCEKAKQKDLLVVPGEGFGCPGWFRLCYCVSYEKILRSLDVFRSLV